jgi:hypothetical protein
VAEVDGELRAAMSLSDGRTIADPFHNTTDLVALLRVHAAQIRGGRSRLAARAGLWQALRAPRPVAEAPARPPRRAPERPVSLATYGLLRAH